MQLFLSTWTHHLNHLVYSLFYHCQSNKIKFDIVYDETIAHNGARLLYDKSSVFFDYSDDSLFIENHQHYDCYFKRSLRQIDFNENIHPLNFNVPMTYKSHKMLFHLKPKLLFDKSSRVEVFRALDKYGWFSQSSHGILDIRRYPQKRIDSGGKVLFHTRLWNPDNHPDSEEKERRRLQNDFRINACRIIKNNFKDSSVGIFADHLSCKIAPDILLDPKQSNKNNYLNTLLNYDIGIADDGLKDTPGWKIGEYLLYGKAVITTPINVVLDDFKDSINYEALSSRSAYTEIPDKIHLLLNNKKYLEQGINNFKWSDEYLHPKNYIQRILNKI